MNEWNDLETFPPNLHQPVEYKIEVVCKGWYNPSDDKHIFFPSDQEMPACMFTAWRPWKEGVKWEDRKLNETEEENA